MTMRRSARLSDLMWGELWISDLDVKTIQPKMQSSHQAFSSHQHVLVDCMCFQPPKAIHCHGSNPIQCADSPTNPPAWPVYLFNVWQHEDSIATSQQLNL